ncbi:MAG: lipoyl synthase [Chlamydiales bacterium]|nr:lipoyl synthase [Chlamydiales bacterium]
MDESRFKNTPHVSRRRLNVLPDNPEGKEEGKAVGPGRFPPWLHRKLPKGNTLWKTQGVLAEKRLPTVCEEAKCPNLLECWSKNTATFLAMGSACTRNCGFCDIDFAANPKPLEPDEPLRLAESAKALGLKHVVVTMVARDDLPDGGAAHIAAIIRALREVIPESSVEVLTSDFFGSEEALRTILNEKPEVFNHNIETVRELTPRVRHRATYERSLNLLRSVGATAPGSLVKSGLMVGLGESDSQVKETICDLRDAGCQIITIGQYLQPNRQKLRVKRFVTPAQFEEYAAFGKEIGIKHIYSGPFVRSSYNAASVFEREEL